MYKRALRISLWVFYYYKINFVNQSYYFYLAPGPPIIVSTSAATLGTIVVTFHPTPPSMRNGIVSMYTVQYQNETDTLAITVLPRPIILTANLVNLNPGSEYRVRIAAHNGAGIGPYTPDVSQTALSIPPNIPMDASFQRNNDRQVTQTTIPILLPNILDITSYRWVIV